MRPCISHSISWMRHALWNSSEFGVELACSYAVKLVWPEEPLMILTNAVKTMDSFWASGSGRAENKCTES